MEKRKIYFLKNKNINKKYTIKINFSILYQEIKNYYIKKNEKKRLKILNYFFKTSTKLEWITLIYIPITPPETRPIIKLSDNTIVTSNINIIYSKIINTNNRIRTMKEMKVTETFISNEKTNIQKSIDELIIKSKKHF